MARVYMPKHRGEPTLDRHSLSALIMASMVDVLHDSGLSEPEKVVALRALRGLSVNVADYWARCGAYLPGGIVERSFLRLCGLGADGELAERWLDRIGDLAEGN